jgi:hypothetical protein
VMVRIADCLISFSIHQHDLKIINTIDYQSNMMLLAVNCLLQIGIIQAPAGP